MPTPSLRSISAAERWSLVNAVLMLGATLAAGWMHSVWPLLGVGIGSLMGLLGTGWNRWTPHGQFGTANGVTALRIGLFVLLPPVASLAPSFFVLFCVFLLALDGIDGWLARHQSLSSEFGAFFDKEADALFLLLLCALATFRGPLPVWILGAGLLRYGFVLLLFLLPQPEKTEDRSSLARYTYGAMVVALLTSFLPYPLLYGPLVAFATTALVFSFGRSLWRIVPHGQAFGGP